MASRLLELQPKDSRKYFMLPQAPEDAGYYVYGQLHGRSSNGTFQYAHSSMMTAILRVEREWQAMDSRKFGVGDISLADGLANTDHASHKSGLDVDVRPMRKDGLHLPVTWGDAEYDHDATAKLIGLFLLHSRVELVYFNGPGIAFVTPLKGHDNHFHVKLRG
jgi:hypothetical protein